LVGLGDRELAGKIIRLVGSSTPWLPASLGGGHRGGRRADGGGAGRRLEAGTIALTKLIPSTGPHCALPKSDLAAAHEEDFVEVALDQPGSCENFSAIVENGGRRQRGAATFAKLCLQCHGMREREFAFGPDLSGIATRPKEKPCWWTSLIRAGRSRPDFISYTVTTTEGETVTGLITARAQQRLLCGGFWTG